MYSIFNCKKINCWVAFLIIFPLVSSFGLMKERNIKSDVFNPISADLNIDDMKAIPGVSVTEPDFLEENIEMKAYVLGNNFLYYYDVILPNGVKVQVVEGNLFSSNKSTDCTDTFFISCTDKKFNYKGLRIGMPLHEAVNFMVDPVVDFDFFRKNSVSSENGVRFIFGSYFPEAPKKVWKSNIVTEIIQFQGVDDAVALKTPLSNWKNFYIPKNFSDWLSDEIKKNGGNRLFHPIHIGMKRRDVSRLIKILQGFREEFVYGYTRVLMYEGILNKNDIGIKVRIGFCNELFPGSPGDVKDENDQVLYYIETVDKSFVSETGIRVGMPLSKIIKKNSNIKWEYGCTDDVHRLRYYYKDGTTIVVNPSINGSLVDYTDISTVSRFSIYSIEQNPPFCWENASNFLTVAHNNKHEDCDSINKAQNNSMR